MTPTSLRSCRPGKLVSGAHHSLRACLAASLAAACLWGTGLSLAQEQLPTPRVHSSVMALSLEECLYLALQKQPALAADRASLAAAEDGLRSLETLRVPTFLAPELPFRRQQASLGVASATAGVERGVQETVYAVTRTYFTVLYAREQEQVTGKVVERLSSVNQVAERMLKAGAREVNAIDVERTSVYADLAETRRIQAAKGVERALAALQEAIGLGPECGLQVAAGRLPEPTVRPNRQEIVAWALARRADLLQASTFAEVTGLEIGAQGTSNNTRMETFAAGADIHAREIVQGTHDTEYRPGAIPPEMPATLAGICANRVAHAQSLNARAHAVVEKTRNLIALEAQNAFLQWEEAAEQAARAQRAANTGDKMAEGVRKDFAAGQKVRVEDVLTVQVLASQARGQYNEYLYREIVALAELERVTAGAFRAGLAGPPRPPASGAPGK